MARLVPQRLGKSKPFSSFPSDDEDDDVECDITDTTTRVTFPEEMFEIQNDRDSVRRRGTIREVSRSMKQAPPKDDTLFAVKDDEKFSVFEKVFINVVLLAVFTFVFTFISALLVGYSYSSSVVLLLVLFVYYYYLGGVVLQFLFRS